MTLATSTGTLCDKCLTIVGSTEPIRHELGENLNLVVHPDLPGVTLAPIWNYHWTCASFPLTS